MNISVHTYIAILVIHLTTSCDLVCQDKLNPTYEQPSLTPITIATDTFQEVEKEVIYNLPPENKVVLHTNIYLQWEDTNKPGESKLQIAMDKMFTNIIVDTVLAGNHFLIPALFPHKTYYWRIIHLSEHAISDDSFTFFKTTTIQLDSFQNVEPLSIIPTWVEDMEVIFILNPDLVKYSVHITDENSETKLKRNCITEKFAFETASWPRGKYKMSFSMPNKPHSFKTFVLK